MKKLFLSLCLCTSVALTAAAQTTNTNTTPILTGPGLKAFEFLTTGATNWMFAPYAIYDLGTESLGGGIGAGYKVSDFVVPTLRLDYLKGEVWMPSGSVQIQAPLRIAGKLDLVPFVFGGIATPISGRGKDNGQVAGIFGAGAAIRISAHWDIIGDYEKWSGFKGQQLRFGLLYKF